MKIAITTKKAAADSSLDTRFGRAAFFAIIDLEAPDQPQFIENQAVQEGHGAGVMAAQTLIDNEISAVVSGKFGPNGDKALKNAGILQYVFGSETTIDEVLSAYNNEALQKA